MENNWKIISVDGYPQEGEMCWLYDINKYGVWVGYLVSEDDSPCWMIVVNDFYPIDWIITAECEPAYINVTHWQLLPSLPIE